MSGSENKASSSTDNEPTDEKIRRPPNAFMVFACEYRGLVAERNPNVSNKVISSLLGKIWKETSDDIRRKYYQKADELRKQHKAKYPEYVYCPRDARLEKMKRKKMKAQQIVTKIKKSSNAGSLKTQKDTGGEAAGPSNTKERKPVDAEVPSSPGYVPNNPDYFSEYSEDTSNDESAILVPDPSRDQDSESWKPGDTSTLANAISKIDYPEFRSFSNSNSCSSSRSDLRSGCMTPFGSGLDVRRFPDPYPYFPGHFPGPFLSPFYSAPRPFAGPMSPYPYAPSYMPPNYHPYPPPYWGFASPRPPPADHKGLYDAYAGYGQPQDIYPQPFGFYRDLMFKEKFNSLHSYGFTSAEEQSYPRGDTAEGNAASTQSTGVDTAEDKASKCGTGDNNEEPSRPRARTPVQDPPTTPLKNAVSEQLKSYSATPPARLYQGSLFDRRHESTLSAEGRIPNWYTEPEGTYPFTPRSSTRLGPTGQSTVGRDPRLGGVHEEPATIVDRNPLPVQSGYCKGKATEGTAAASSNPSQADLLRGVSSAAASIPMERHEAAPLSSQKRHVGTSQTSLGTPQQLYPGYHLSGPMAANVLYGSQMNLDRNSFVRRKVLDASCQKP